MHLVFYIGLGIGLSTAAGLRPFLPTLLAGLLGVAGALGVGFSHSGYRFMESAWWLILVAVLFALAWGAQLRIGAERLEDGNLGAVLAGLGIGAGALLFAGTLAHHGKLAWPGLVGGAACALVAHAALRPILSGARLRLGERGAREALTAYLDGAALIAAAVACALHPLGFVLLALVLWLLVARRRRGAEKYAGLRILRR